MRYHLKAVLITLPLLWSTLWADKLSFSSAVKKAVPSVVSIQSERSVANELNPFFNDPFFRQFFNDPRLNEPTQKVRGLGSGVIVSNKGYVITNYHVIKDATSITVKLNDGRELPAKVIASDPPSDVGVLKLEASDLPVATLGNSDKLEVGDVVLAIGNPFAIGQTVTQGIISGLQRKNQESTFTKISSKQMLLLTLAILVDR